jgi:adenine-specific DNA-methyltransferase
MPKKSKYSHLSRKQLEAKIEKLERERYGLVWEDKEEDVAKQCDAELPVLKEDADREIVCNPDLPYNYIIEGDNYHSLYTLNFTHKKKIDVIYIDPPYNTGNNDFRYNDHWVDNTDSYRHSKWLSFMNKRLRLAKNLLKDSGIIFISIDDNEVAQLKLLCNIIFSENNFVGLFIHHARQNVDSRSVTGASLDHQYILVYRKTEKAKLRGKVINKDKYKNPDNDPRGPWMSSPIDGLATKENRPNLHYIIINPLTNDKYKPSSATGWRFQKSTLDQMIQDNRIIWPKNKSSKPRMKRFLSELQNEYTGFSSILSVDFTTQGTNELREIFGKETLKFPKPISLIYTLVEQSCNKNSLVLDFFAGSGTTGHAVLELNKEDGGNRQFILCTNNENNICEEVTCPRIKKVIEGYADKAAIPANLKYFKQTFVPNITNDQDKRELVNRSTELLCMTENAFESVTKRKVGSEFAIYKNRTKQVAIIYDEDSIEKCVTKLNTLKINRETVVYVFSYDHDYNEDDFTGLKMPFLVRPIPEAILNVYRKIAKSKKK